MPTVGALRLVPVAWCLGKVHPGVPPTLVAAGSALAASWSSWRPLRNAVTAAGDPGPTLVTEPAFGESRACTIALPAVVELLSR
jgi:hypothetical protein